MQGQASASPGPSCIAEMEGRERGFGDPDPRRASFLGRSNRPAGAPGRSNRTSRHCHRAGHRVTSPYNQAQPKTWPARTTTPGPTAYPKGPIIFADWSAIRTTLALILPVTSLNSTSPACLGPAAPSNGHATLSRTAGWAGPKISQNTPKVENIYHPY
jgi:hypothetical protein